MTEYKKQRRIELVAEYAAEQEKARLARDAVIMAMFDVDTRPLETRCNVCGVPVIDTELHYDWHVRTVTI